MSELHDPDYLDARAAQRLSRFDRILEPVRRLFRWAGVLLLAVLISLPVMQVVLRQFGSPFIGAEELARFMLICVVFVTLPYVVSSGAAVRMEELLHALPHRLRRGLRIVIPITGALGFGAAAVSVAVATMRNLDNETPTLQIPYWVFFSAAFLGLLFAAVECAAQFVKACRDDPLYLTFAAERSPDGAPDL
jgi:TRAP-type C4-dicarboxylate transport system permease small subunit